MELVYNMTKTFSFQMAPPSRIEAEKFAVEKEPLERAQELTEDRSW